uniref:Uncharacterized protein n=1 Tax=Oryza brachyantha TaxID=4533 RepID=J3MS55_ORYBR
MAVGRPQGYAPAPAAAAAAAIWLGKEMVAEIGDCLPAGPASADAGPPEPPSPDSLSRWPSSAANAVREDGKGRRREVEGRSDRRRACGEGSGDRAGGFEKLADTLYASCKTY